MPDESDQQQDQTQDQSQAEDQQQQKDQTTTQDGRVYVNVNEITDPEKLRDIQRNPHKYTDVKSEEKQATDKTEGADEKKDGEDKEQDGTEGQDKTEEGEGKDGEDQQQQDETRQPGRLKVRTRHLDDAGREVLEVVSQKKVSLPKAQEIVVERLVKGGKSLAEAEKLVYGEHGRRSAAAPEDRKQKQSEQSQDEEKDAVDPIAKAEGELTDLRSQLAQARKDYNVLQIEEIRDKIDEKKDELRDLKSAKTAAERERVQTVESQFESEVAESVTLASTLFPDAAKEGTELFEAIQDEVEDLKESNPGFFNNPKWPEMLAAVKAAELGIPSTKHKAGARSAQGEKKEPTPPKKAAARITPAPGTSGGAKNTDPVPDDPDAEYAAAGTDPVKLIAWLRKWGRKDMGRRLPIADAMAS